MDSEIAEILAGQKQLEIKFESVSDAMHDHDTHPDFNFWDLSRQCPLCVCVYIYIYRYIIREKQVSLWRRANAQKVRLYYPYILAVHRPFFISIFYLYIIIYIYTVEPLLMDTPIKQTPLLSGHLSKVPDISLIKPYSDNPF